MSKVLFITFHDINDSSFGGAIASRRNYDNLVSIYKKVDIYVIKKRSDFSSIFSLLENMYPPIRKQDVKNIQSMINEIDILFLDSSLFGIIGKEVRKNKKDIKIISFFHNCELDYNKFRFGNKNSIQRNVYEKLIKREEKTTCLVADAITVLNRRDKQRIKELYNTDASCILPITLKDSYEKSKNKSFKGLKNYCLLFGPDCFANIEGFRWFVNEIAPNINEQIVIAGKGMEKYEEEFSSSRIHVFGYVDDLNDLYEYSKYVVIPLFSGAGMKIKTAEALMYGKYIFGTSEAFEGYNLNYEKIGGIFSNSDELLSKLEKMNENTNRLNEYSRLVFLNKYSEAAGKNILAICINQLNGDNL